MFSSRNLLVSLIYGWLFFGAGLQEGQGQLGKFRHAACAIMRPSAFSKCFLYSSCFSLNIVVADVQDLQAFDVADVADTAIISDHLSCLPHRGRHVGPVVYQHSEGSDLWEVHQPRWSVSNPKSSAVFDVNSLRKIETLET